MAMTFNARAFLTKPGEGRKLLRLRKAQVVFSLGDDCAGMYYLQTGRVKISANSRHGKEAIVLGPGDFLGEACLAGQSHAITSAVAMEEVILLQIERGTFQETLHTEPTFADLFLRYVLSRNIHFEEDLIDQLFNSSEKRLARILLLMARYGNAGDPEPKIPKITQATLAEMVGTTRARVSKFMNKFRELGLIDYDGQITVHKSLLTVPLHDSSPSVSGSVRVVEPTKNRIGE
jgi:CRP/FNR family cyclic AMP-dependent transcriptional regulator